MEKEKIEYLDDVDLVGLRQICERNGRWSGELNAWEKTGNKVLKINLSSQRERTNALIGIREWKKKNKKDYTVYSARTGYTVYVIKG